MAPRKPPRGKSGSAPGPLILMEPSSAVFENQTEEKTVETAVTGLASDKDPPILPEQSGMVVTPIVKKERGTNYSCNELICLAKCWAETSMDPGEGNDIRQETFWARVKVAFDREFASKDCNADSLSRT